MKQFYSFAAIVPPQAKILLLGSMPSTRSVVQQQYYAHPQNAFWPILAQIYTKYLDQEDLETWQQGRHQQLPFVQKRSLLERAGIALWDVLTSCLRQNSADASICNAVCNPIAELVESQAIGCILLNGQKAAALFHKHIALRSLRGAQQPCERLVITLPSSSPANATMTFTEKLAAWQKAIREAEEFAQAFSPKLA